MVREGIDDELWWAVADPSRRRVLDTLIAQGEGTPTSLARELPLTRQAITKHLAVLEHAGLVESRHQGREVRFTVRPEGLNLAAEAMARVANRWDVRLQALKRRAESAHRESGSEQREAADTRGEGSENTVLDPG